MPDKPRCGDCRFWGAVERMADPLLRDDREDYRKCGRILFADRNLEDREGTTNIAMCCDGSDFAAALVCREDFGCVLFEGKSNESEPVQGMEDESPFWAPWHKTNG